jgi:ABC-type multidrug transport system ATPase subunit
MLNKNIPIIETNSASKNFGNVEAVSDINLTIQQGELMGLIGPDGAGKTTLFRIFSTLLIPDKGWAHVMGADVVKDYRFIRQNLGFMPGQNSVYNDLSIEENLNFYATVYGTSLAKSYDIIRDIYVQIEPFKDRPAGKLSGGMRQKLALCCSIIHKPDLLILDEPTTGVDAVSRREFWDIIKKLNNEGMSILVSTPYMDEARLCSTIGLMQQGKLMAVDSPSQLPERYPLPIYAIRANEFYNLLLELEAWNETYSVYTFGQYLHFTPKNKEMSMNKLQAFLESRNHSNIYIEPITAGIEDCFMYLVKQTPSL